MLGIVFCRTGDGDISVGMELMRVRQKSGGELSGKFHILEMRTRRTVRDFGMITAGEHVLAAVSGGADSTALLVCLKNLSREMKLTLTAAHLNHRLRGAEGDADAEFVRRLCADLGIPCIEETIDVGQQAEIEGGNLESVARRLRYDFLRRVAVRTGAYRIAVGHNKNDQAETVLFRFLRGAGLQGLSAIRPIHGHTPGNIIIRPLIDCSRELIRKYLVDNKIGWREDSSNADLGYARNRIRRELIPYLEKNFNPQVIDTLARETALARETWDFLETQAAATGEYLLDENDENTDIDIHYVSLSAAKLSSYHPALQKQILRRILREHFGSLEDVGAAHIESLVALCKAAHGNGEVELPHDLRGVRQFDRLLLRKRQPVIEAPEFSCTLTIPGQCFIDEIKTELQCTIIHLSTDMKVATDDFHRRVLLDPVVLPESLTVRSRKPGDHYGGVGHRKVKKLLIDNRIPQEQRAKLMMIATGDAVIWIPGFKPARGYAARPDATTGVLVEVKEPRISHSC